MRKPARKPKAMKPWKGWALVDDEGPWLDTVARTRAATERLVGLHVRFDGSRIVRVEVREVPRER